MQQTPAGGTDWLYHAQTPVCIGGLGGDVHESELLYRVVLTVFVGAILATVFCLHIRWLRLPLQPALPKRNPGFVPPAALPGFPIIELLPETSKLEDGVPPPSSAIRRSRNKKPARERLWHLDYARIICVVAVVMDHTGGSGVTSVNQGWSLMWTQQFLMLVSGMGFMLSRAPLYLYVVRMLIISLVGIGINWLGYVAAGGKRNGFAEICVPQQCVKYIDPARDQSIGNWDFNLDDIIFQMGYTLLLAGLGVALVSYPA